MWITLILVALPLDLHTATPGANPADLTVRLELMPGEGGLRYRIIHQYRGDQPRRFVTGATDRNCEEPIDVLMVDGTVSKLYSSLPCGGFAFTSSRVVRPGESWTLEGAASPPAKAQLILARYCPKAEDLRAVAPKEKAPKEPPWWLGCVDSQPVSMSSDAGSPDAAWAQLLAAMRKKDAAGLQRLTTAQGLASLHRGASGDPVQPALARLGTAWSAFEVRWRLRAADRAAASMGPRVKEHGLEFVRDAAGWRLDRWSPGE